MNSGFRAPNAGSTHVSREIDPIDVVGRKRAGGMPPIICAAVMAGPVVQSQGCMVFPGSSSRESCRAIADREVMGGTARQCGSRDCCNPGLIVVFLQYKACS